MIKEYKINEYITLKLDENLNTCLYFDGEFFEYLESVFIPISGDKIKIFKEIRSIDEAIEVYKNYEEPWDYLEPYDENVMYVDVDEIYDNPEKYQKYLKCH